MKEAMEFGIEKRSFSRVVETLLTTPPEEILESAKTFEIRGLIDGESLRKLTTVPFEFQLYRTDGVLYLATGTESAALHDNDQENIDRSRRATMLLHNHPPASGVAGDTPSIGDIIYTIILAGEGLRPINVLIHEKACVVFQAAKDGVTLDEMSKEYDPLLAEYGLDPKAFEGDYFDDSYMTALQYKVWRQLAGELGMVPHRAEWDDAKEMQKILDIINAT